MTIIPLTAYPPYGRACAKRGAVARRGLNGPILASARPLRILKVIIGLKGSKFNYEAAAEAVMTTDWAIMLEACLRHDEAPALMRRHSFRKKRSIFAKQKFA